MAIGGFKSTVRASSDVIELQALLERCRESLDLPCIRSDDVVPDSSNRMHTGLSVDHMHFVASSMMHYGFRARNTFGRQPEKAHDIPVLVRGGPTCPVAARSLQTWREQAATDVGYPRVGVEEGATGWFTSLGNGHFTQALNLFRQGRKSVFTGTSFAVPPGDRALRTALERGVPSIVLRSTTSIEDRRRIAHLLNSTHDYKWTVDRSGAVDITPSACTNAKYNQFEAQCKVADSEALTALVRLELGVGMDGRENSAASLAAPKQSKL